ncbi:UNVERIFIED_CONTAM: hypothetical protein RKD50_001142 [Streptomyces canus]
MVSDSVMRWLSSITATAEVPTPTTAVTIGSTATQTARKTNSSTTKARAMPMASATAFGSGVTVNACPLSATCRPPDSGAVASSLTWSIWASLTSRSKATVA